jgi:23S rRNA (guanine2445-N2)-methyltransferase / 23S rRNA (guanine2069-N7)-methyltransferase
MPERFKLVATASRGTEDILADELRALGLTGIRQRRGAVELRGSLLEGLRACIELRTAMRLLMPLGTVEAPDANGLYEGLRTLPWIRHLDLRRTFAIDVSGSSEGLTHTLFVAQKAKDAIVDTLRERFGARPDVDVKDPDVRVVVHLNAGKADISLDLAGDSLHRRGYRVRPHPASLKETLAAAIVLASGWKGDVPLADPMCGAGTIAIEAALFAEGRAPNARRKFGAERWPSFGDRDRLALEELRQAALARPRKPRAAIYASDRDPRRSSRSSRTPSAPACS